MTTIFSQLKLAAADGKKYTMLLHKSKFCALSNSFTLPPTLFVYLIAVTGLLVFSLLLPAAMGFAHGKPSIVEAWDWKNILFVVLIFFALSQYRITRWFVALPLILIFGLYMPAGLLYGKPSLIVSIAVLQTNPAEAGEFLTNIPWQVFAGVIGLLASGFIGVFYSSKIRVSAKIILGIGVASFIIGEMISFGSAVNSKAIQTVYFFRLLRPSVIDGYAALKEEEKLGTPSWQIASVKPRYKTYVVIIGESQRRDYASVYGYPLNTTPYLNNANGTFFSNFITAGGNTVISLPRMLSYNIPGSEQYSKDDNIITLANAAGFDTWWISNQGRGGPFDNPIAQIGIRSHHTIWLKGNWADENVDDDNLLPKIQEVLKVKPSEDKPRLIFVHLMGSHPTFCERLSGRPVAFNVGDSAMNCYLTTYRTSDAFIKRTVDLLKTEAGNSWSLLYFSDHGLSMQEKPGTPLGKELMHGTAFRQNYEVPFLNISSDSRAHDVNPAYRTGFRLLEGMAEWMGISASNINLKNSPDFWSKTNDEDIHVAGKQLYHQLANDPALHFSSQLSQNHQQNLPYPPPRM